MKNFIAMLIVQSLVALATTQKAPITVVHTGNDLIGERLNYFVEENIRQSSTMRVSSTSEAKIIMYLHSLEYESAIVSMYGIVLCYWTPEEPDRFYFIDSFIGYCGSERVRDSAETIVAWTVKSLGG